MSPHKCHSYLVMIHLQCARTWCDDDDGRIIITVCGDGGISPRYDAVYK